MFSYLHQVENSVNMNNPLKVKHILFHLGIFSNFVYNQFTLHTNLYLKKYCQN